MIRTPTPEQEQIIAASRSEHDSLSINAFAGTGKTTTLEMLGQVQSPRLRCAAFAFNKSIVAELAPRFPKHFKVQTLNGCGHAALCRTINNIELDTKKLSRLAREQRIFGDEADAVKELVSLAMMKGIVPEVFGGIKGLTPDTSDEWRKLGDEEPAESAIEMARELLLLSIREALQGTISFDDQIYVSVFFNCRYPKYDLVLVDEAQDLSKINHEQIRKCASGRIIAVGDIRQAIYAWRGADAQSINSLKRLREAWIDRPLTTTFRCPKIIVERNKHHAPGFNALENAPEGRALTFKAEWNWRMVQELCIIDFEFAPKKAVRSLAVLCRNNAPLITLALKLLAQRIPAKVLGRDIAQGLIKLSRKLAPEDDTGQQELMRRLAEWKITEVSKSEANEDGRAAGIEDRADSLIAVASSVRTSGELRRVLSEIFADENLRSAVILSSVHKAKGREWDCVLHLDPWRCPSKWAKTPAAMEQERNLRYVCETRTKHTLIEANLEDFR